jgi:hypothetical protein
VLDIDSPSEPVVAEALAEHDASARRHGCLVAYVYVHENPHRVGGGLNTHFLASVPADLRAALQDRLADHLGRVC